MEAAERSIWGDGRLLGVPGIRWNLVRIVAGHALAELPPDDVPCPAISDPVNRAVVEDAARRAARAVCAALAGLLSGPACVQIEMTA